MVVTAAAIALIVVLVLGRVKRPIQTRGGGFGLLLVQQGDGLGAHAAAADGVEHVVQGERGIGAGQGELLLLGDRERQAQVLEEVLNQEAGLVVAVDRLRGELLHGTGAARAGADHLAHLLDVEIVLLGKGEGVGHTYHGARQGDLVGELRGLALAGTAEAADLGGEGLEHLADGLDIALGGADDGREGAGDGTGLAARHGAVEGVLAAHLGGAGDIAGELGRAGGEVDEIGTILGRGQQALARQVDLLHIRGEADHGKDHVGVLGGLGDGIGPGGAALDEVGGLFLGAVVDGELVARVHDVAGNGCAHDAGADKGDLEVLACHMQRSF